MKKILKTLLCLILCAVIILFAVGFATGKVPTDTLRAITPVTKNATVNTVKTGIDSAVSQIRTIIDNARGGD